MPLGPTTNEAIRTLVTRLNHRRRAIFKKKDLEQIVIENLPDLGENQRAIIKGQLLSYLWERNKLREVEFEFPARKETRYLYGDITNFELTVSRSRPSNADRGTGRRKATKSDEIMCVCIFDLVEPESSSTGRSVYSSS